MLYKNIIELSWVFPFNKCFPHSQHFLCLTCRHNFLRNWLPSGTNFLKTFLCCCACRSFDSSTVSSSECSSINSFTFSSSTFMIMDLTISPFSNLVLYPLPILLFSNISICSTYQKPFTHTTSL